MKLRQLATIFFLLLICFTANLLGMDNYPFIKYYARVKKQDINVRGRPTTSSEIMYQLKKRSDVLVIGESGSWLKVQPKPEFRFAFVFKELVEDGLIAKSNVNIRSSATTSSSILGKLSDGDPVHIVEDLGEWLKIEMPRDFGYWISKSLLEYLCPAEEYQDYLVREKEAKVAFKQAEDFRRKELTKRYNEVDHSALIQTYELIIEKYPGTAQAKKSIERILDTREKKAMARQKKITLNERRKVLKLYEEAESLRKGLLSRRSFTPSEYKEVHQIYKRIISEYPGATEARESLLRISELEKLKEEKMEEFERIFTFNDVGKLKKAKHSIYDRASHKLTRGFSRVPKGALFSKNIDLRAYEGRKVIVEGTIVSNEENSSIYPLVEVTKITLQS